MSQIPPSTENDERPSPDDGAPAPIQHLTRRAAREAAEAEAEAEAEAARASTTSAASADAHTGAARHDETASLLGWRQQHYVSHEPAPKKRSLKGLWVTLIVVAVLGGLGGTAYGIFQPEVSNVITDLQPDDYTGSGSGHVTITIKSGDIGLNVADALQKAGVTKTSTAFYKLLLTQHPAPVFQPGVYKLAKQMSAKAALSALENPSNKINLTAVIPEGTTESNVLIIISKSTGIPLAQLQAAASDPAQYGVPAQAKTLEGFLFPATYSFSPGISAHDVIKTMVDRSFQSLNADGVAPADRWNTVILASIVQKEAGLNADFPKVARVFLNRIAAGWDLQSDATVAYGAGTTGTVTTTDAERADASNPYNTYVHPGLPVGPISNPGDVAIDAVQHPAVGSWMYFVTWNLKTGETIFSTTLAEQNAAVAKWQQWMKENPGYG